MRDLWQMNLELEKVTSAFENELFLDEGSSVYAVLDGAQVADLPGQLEAKGVEHECLFLGELEPEVAAVAPYLVKIDASENTFEWVVEDFAAKNALIFILAERSVMEVRRHLRGLALAEMPDGKVVFFRYYDPRSLCQILPLATSEQERSFFGKNGEYRFVVLNASKEVVNFGSSNVAAR